MLTHEIKPITSARQTREPKSAGFQSVGKPSYASLHNSALLDFYTPSAPLRTPQKRPSIQPLREKIRLKISPEKKFLHALDTARNGMVNKKPYQTGFDLLPHSPTKVGGTSKNSLFLKTYRNFDESVRDSASYASPGGHSPKPTIRYEEKSFKSPVGKLMALNSSTPILAEISEDDGREVFGLRYLSSKRANQEAI